MTATHSAYRPGGFRLNFRQSRPSPQPRQAPHQIERANTTSTTDFEDLSSSATLPPSSGNDARDAEPPTPVSTPSNSNVLPDLSFEALDEDERQLVLEGNEQRAGETKRMSTFFELVADARTTFLHNSQERRDKIEALFKSHDIQFTKNEQHRQATFTQDLERFSLVAKDSQAARVAERSANESARVEVVERGRKRRVLVKDLAEKELEQLANAIREEQQRIFEKENQEMDATVAQLVRASLPSLSQILSQI